MKLNKITEITGTITLKTGLHIGSGDTELHIGGTDQPVVKHPYTKEPYIPGSSLKGKIRSLLELKSGLIALQKDKGPINIDILKKLKDDKQDKKQEAIKILKLFGVSASEQPESNLDVEIGPARASFADAYLTDDSRKLIREKQASFFELKSETSIDRINCKANPRFIERVVAGLKFNFFIYFKEMEGDNGLIDYLLEGIRLLELDALGGSGSRGYGKVVFEFDDSELNNKFRNLKPFNEE